MPTTPLAAFVGHGLLEQSGRGRRKPFRLPANVSYPAGQVLGELVGANAVYTVTLGTQSSGNFTLTLLGQTTGNIAYNATAAAVATALQALTNLSNQGAVQTLTLGSNATGGTYKLSWRGQQTTPLAYNATSATVQAALQALSSIGAGNITVSGGPLSSGALTFTWGGSLAGVPVPDLMEIDTTFLVGFTSATFASTFVGGGSSVASDITATGSAGGPYTVTFGGSLGKQNIALTATFTGLGTPGNASLATTTAGSAGTPGTAKACLASATDGSQAPVGVLEYPCSTDANGLIYWGLSTTSPDFAGRGRQSAPVFVTGEFESKDLTGMDQAFLQPAGPFRLAQGTVLDGRILLPG